MGAMLSRDRRLLGNVISPFSTRGAFTAVLKAWNVKISMDGKGRFKDNIFIERLWRTLKYERIYLKDYDNGADLYRDLTIWF